MLHVPKEKLDALRLLLRPFLDQNSHWNSSFSKRLQISSKTKVCTSQAKGLHHTSCDLAATTLRISTSGTPNYIE